MFLSTSTIRVADMWILEQAGSALKYQLFQSLAVEAFLKTYQWDATRKAARGGKSWASPTSMDPLQKLCGAPS